MDSPELHVAKTSAAEVHDTTESIKSDVARLLRLKRWGYVIAGTYLLTAVTIFGVINTVQAKNAERVRAQQLAKIVATNVATHRIDVFVTNLSDPNSPANKALEDFIVTCVEHPTETQCPKGP